jgi:hypothetical protein
MVIRTTRIPATPIIHNTLRMVEEAGPVATALQTLKTISGKAANMATQITPIRIRKAEPTMICGSTTRVRRMRSEKQAGGIFTNLPIMLTTGSGIICFPGLVLYNTYFSFIFLHIV